MKLYGGFTSGETVFADRNWVANATILIGDLDGSGSITSADAFHVVICAGGSATLDGFTVSGGNANGTAMLSL